MNDVQSLILPHDTVWAMYEPAARQISEMLTGMNMAAHLRDVASHPLTDSIQYFHAFSAEPVAGSKDGAVRVSVDDQYKPYIMDGTVAVLNLSGPMTKGGTSLSRASSTVYTGRMMDLAARDKDVSAIILRVDSPGGSVSGTEALANRVTAAAKLKPVIGVIEDLCASAGYWVISGATFIYANPTAMVGSIGTYMAVTDYSRAAANAGHVVHRIATGKHKGAGIPGTEITPEQLAAWQAQVDGLNAHFLAAVARNRQMDPDAVSEIADGQTHLAADALTMGLIDAIGTYDTALSALALQENNMKFLDRLRASMAGGTPSPEAAEAAEVIAAAADTELAEKDAQIAAQQTAADLRLAEALAAKDQEIASLKAHQVAGAAAAAQIEEERLAAEAQAREDENQAAIEDLVAAFKLTPAVSAQAAELRAASPDAFDSLFGALSPLTTIAGNSRPAPRSKRTADAADVAGALSGQTTDQLTQLADAKVEASKGKTPFHVAFSEVCAENPELAAAYAAANSTRR